MIFDAYISSFDQTQYKESGLDVYQSLDAIAHKRINQNCMFLKLAYNRGHGTYLNYQIWSHSMQSSEKAVCF